MSNWNCKECHYTDLECNEQCKEEKTEYAERKDKQQGEEEMMTFMEISTYLGMANILLKQAEVEDDTDVMKNIRQAIIESQLYFAKKGLENIVSEEKSK